MPADGIGATPTEPRFLPGILLAGLASLCLAMTVSMLRFPVASILLVAILLGSSAGSAMAVVILAAVPAFIVTELIDPPPRT